MTYLDKDGVGRYIVTSKEYDRTYYYLYKVSGEALTKVSKNKNPIKLEELMK